MKLKNVYAFLKSTLKANDKIVAGISGGPDSMCLLHILINIRQEIPIQIICAHVNHNVREESLEEAEFVKQVCLENNVDFEYYKIENYEKENFESNARTKRYTFYQQLIKKYQAKYLVTAHHGDDLVETILMKLTRGSNLSGYTGFRKCIEYNNYTLLRPLIYVTKDEIEKYNNQNTIEYRIDRTNFDERYTRNRYRHQFLPLLKKENKNVHLKFLNFSEELSEVEDFLQNATQSALTNVYDSGNVNLREFNKLDSLLKKRVIEYLLKEEYHNEINKLNKKHLNAILNLCNSNKPNQTITLPNKKKVMKSYDKLSFASEIEKNTYGILEDELKINATESIVKITNTEVKKSNYVIRLNSKELQLPLKIRTKREGDRMSIKNFIGTKKLQDIFVNAKVPKNKRNTWPILVDATDEIIWIPGIKKSKFDKNYDEFYDIIYKYVISEEKKENE